VKCVVCGTYPGQIRVDSALAVHPAHPKAMALPVALPVVAPSPAVVAP
jgi:hypothetical protein